MCNCNKEVKIGDYSNQVILDCPKHMMPLKTILGDPKQPFICIDKCIVEEIKYLWEQDIHTLGCCCGHHIDKGYIQVEPEDEIIMLLMNYIKIDNDDISAFYPKTNYEDGTL